MSGLLAGDSTARGTEAFGFAESGEKGVVHGAEVFVHRGFACRQDPPGDGLGEGFPILRGCAQLRVAVAAQGKGIVLPVCDPGGDGPWERGAMKFFEGGGGAAWISLSVMVLRARSENAPP